jgi:streptogramin lyase
VITGDDGQGTSASFVAPYGITANADGTVWVSDTDSQQIRKISPTGFVSTLAGSFGNDGSSDGTGDSANFEYPYGLTVDNLGNVFVADTFNYTVRKIVPDGTVSTWAGTAGQNDSTDGLGEAARFYAPYGIVADPSGNLYVADTLNHVIRKISPDRTVTTYAGAAKVSGSADGTLTTARFNHPHGIAIDASQNLYVADTFNHTVRKITPDGVVSTLVGSAGVSGFVPGPLPGLLNNPDGLAVSNGVLYITTENAVLRVLLKK